MATTFQRLIGPAGVLAKSYVGGIKTSVYKLKQGIGKELSYSIQDIRGKSLMPIAKAAIAWQKAKVWAIKTRLWEPPRLVDELLKIHEDIRSKSRGDICDFRFLAYCVARHRKGKEIAEAIDYKDERQSQLAKAIFRLPEHVPGFEEIRSILDKGYHEHIGLDPQRSKPVIRGRGGRPATKGPCFDPDPNHLEHADPFEIPGLSWVDPKEKKD